MPWAPALHAASKCSNVIPPKRVHGQRKPSSHRLEALPPYRRGIRVARSLQYRSEHNVVETEVRCALQLSLVMTRCSAPSEVRTTWLLQQLRGGQVHAVRSGVMG